MSLLLRRLCVGKAALVRSSRILSNGFSTSLLQSLPCSIVGAVPCGEDVGKLVISNGSGLGSTYLDKKVPLELMKEMATIGASHGWVATLKDDGILRLQDDLNPFASDSDPKRISLPPLVNLPRCQTKIVTNVSMSSSSPEDEDCVVAVKFLGPQISFCRPAQSKSKWTNINIQNTCFDSSRVIFSKKDEMFRTLGSGGHLIVSWGLHRPELKPKFQKLRFKNLPKLSVTERELMDSCSTSEHLVESISTDETFLVKWYKKTADCTEKMKTKALMVFKVDEQGNAVYTQDIGDLVIFLSNSEPFCVPATSFPGLLPNRVQFFDADEYAFFNPSNSSITASGILACGSKAPAPYHIPPQNIN